MGRGKRILAEKVEGFRMLAHKWRKRDEEKSGKEEVQRNRREIKAGGQVGSKKASGNRAVKRRMEGTGRSNEEILKWVKRGKRKTTKRKRRIKGKEATKEGWGNGVGEKETEGGKDGGMLWRR